MRSEHCPGTLSSPLPRPAGTVASPTPERHRPTRRRARATANTSARPSEAAVAAESPMRARPAGHRGEANGPTGRSSSLARVLTSLVLWEQGPGAARTTPVLTQTDGRRSGCATGGRSTSTFGFWPRRLMRGLAVITRMSIARSPISEPAKCGECTRCTVAREESAAGTGVA
jgi:hypothetical protein